MTERLVVIALRAGLDLLGWRFGERREVPASEVPALLLSHPELVAVPSPLQEPSSFLMR